MVRTSDIFILKKAITMLCLVLVCLFAGLSNANAQNSGYVPSYRYEEPNYDVGYREEYHTNYKKLWKEWQEEKVKLDALKKKHGINFDLYHTFTSSESVYVKHREKWEAKVEAAAPGDWEKIREVMLAEREAKAKFDEWGKMYTATGELRDKTLRDNSNCNIKEMKDGYTVSCFSCVIVKTLIETFANACSIVYDVARDAGIIILGLGTMIWMAFFALKTVSSLANVEPGDLINELLKQLFKVFLALAVLYAGLGVIVDLFINPILATGADYGIGIIESISNPTAGSASNGLPVNLEQIRKTVETDDLYNYPGSRVLSQDVVNRLLTLNMAIDGLVSVNMVVGNALMCHSWNAGIWDAIDAVITTFRIPNVWILFCGALIWVLGFLMSIAVSYYLLDISFKIGLSIMILPITIALWPFAVTSDKLKKAFSIILNAAATFAFLAIVSAMAMMLISKAMGDTSELLMAIEQNKDTEVSARFEVTGSYFILIVFACVYGFLLVGKANTDYASAFFGDSVTGGSSPMHHKLTQATMGGKQAAEKLGKYGHDVAKKQVGRKISAGYEKGYDKLKGGVKGAYNKMRGR